MYATRKKTRGTRHDADVESGKTDVHCTSRREFGRGLRATPSCGAIGPTDPLALTLGPTRQAVRPPARLQRGHVGLVQIRQPVGARPNILEEASETEDTNCDVTARGVSGSANVPFAGSLCNLCSERRQDNSLSRVTRQRSGERTGKGLTARGDRRGRQKGISFSELLISFFSTLGRTNRQRERIESRHIYIHTCSPVSQISSRSFIRSRAVNSFYATLYMFEVCKYFSATLATPTR